MTKKATVTILICVALVITASMALAQRQGQGGPRGGAIRPGAQQGRGGTQQGRGGMQPGRGGMQQGGMGAFDPAQMQAMMSQRMQTQVGATDEQWNTIWPKLQKVMELSREASGGGRGAMFAGAGRGGFGGPAGQRGPGGPQAGAGGQQTGARGGPQAGARGPQTGTRGPQTDTARSPRGGDAVREMTAVQKTTQELQQLLRGDAPNAGEIKAKLAALRQAKEAAKQEMAKAQAALKQGLSIEQEARLVIMGYLN